MMAQRSGKAVAGSAEKSRQKPAPKAERPARASVPKMNFADMHALKTLPEKIAAAEIRMAELEQSLSDPQLYARDSARFGTLSDELVRLRTQKDADEERWLTLEMQREALELPE